MRLFFFFLSIFQQFYWVSPSLLAPPATNCHIKSNNSLPEVLKMCQGINMFYSERYEFNGLSQADFNCLFWNVTKIHGWIEFTNITLDSIKFPRLDLIWTSNITFSHNPSLREILFPLLDRLVTDSNGLVFDNNPKLEKLEFPQLRIISWGSHRYENNSALKSIKFSRLRSCIFQNLLILRNPSLGIIEFIQDIELIDIRIEKKLRIEDNESLKEIIFRHKEGEIVQWFIWEEEDAEMRIVNNRNLMAIPTQFFAGNKTLKIRGNPQLSGEILAELRAASNKSSSEIQEIGECMFKEPVTNLALLDICVYVYGQLELAASVEGWTSVRLDRVEGDVFTSEVPIDRLQFLLNTEIYGQFESSLCDFDFSEFKAGRKGTRRGCQTSTTEESTTTGEGENRTSTTGTTTAEKTTTVTLEMVETTRTTEGSPTTETKTTEVMTTVTQETTETIITTTEMSQKTPEMTKGTTIGSTTTEEMTTGSQSTVSQEIILTSPAAPASSFPYRPIIIVSAVLLVFFILLGTVLWAKKTKIKNEKALKQELSSPSSQKSTSTTTSR